MPKSVPGPERILTVPLRTLASGTSVGGIGVGGASVAAGGTSVAVAAGTGVATGAAVGMVVGVSIGKRLVGVNVAVACTGATVGRRPASAVAVPAMPDWIAACRLVLASDVACSAASTVACIFGA